MKQIISVKTIHSFIQYTVIGFDILLGTESKGKRWGQVDEYKEKLAYAGP